MKRQHRYEKPHEEVFCKRKGSSSFAKTAKNKSIRHNLLVYQCAYEDCPTRLYEMWRGQKLDLELDHIDGDRNNHELSNLRLLCKNCHGQTETWGSKKREGNPVKCIDCGKTTYRKEGTRCEECYVKSKPSYVLLCMGKEDMQYLIDNFPLLDIRKKYRIAYETLKNRCDELGVSFKPKGYWQSISTKKSK